MAAMRRNIIILTDITDTARREVHLARLGDWAHDVLGIGVARAGRERAAHIRARHAPVRVIARAAIRAIMLAAHRQPQGPATTHESLRSRQSCGLSHVR